MDVVPLDIIVIVLGSPHLYEKKSILYHEENKYHIFKYGIEYIVGAQHSKTLFSLVSIGKMKRPINASKYVVLMIVKKKEKDVLASFLGWNPIHKKEFVKIISSYDELFHKPTRFPVKNRIIEQ